MLALIGHLDTAKLISDVSSTYDKQASKQEVKLTAMLIVPILALNEDCSAGITLTTDCANNQNVRTQ